MVSRLVDEEIQGVLRLLGGIVEHKLCQSVIHIGDHSQIEVCFIFTVMFDSLFIGVVYFVEQ